MAAVGAQRFLDEIRVTANLRHPHILSLYDSGSADGALFDPLRSEPRFSADAEAELQRVKGPEVL